MNSGYVDMPGFYYYVTEISQRRNSAMNATHVYTKKIRKVAPTLKNLHFAIKTLCMLPHVEAIGVNQVCDEPKFQRVSITL